MSPIASGLIGGIVAVLLTAYIASRVGKAKFQGELRFGPVMWVVGVCCLAMAILPIALTIFFDHHKELWAKVFLAVGFGFGAIYCFVDAAYVRGRFDGEGISFSTPWTGTKNEKWADLVSVKRNDWGGWYALKFNSGKTIRLSRLLTGHLSALEKAGATREF
jgi:hypothetical protein